MLTHYIFTCSTSSGNKQDTACSANLPRAEQFAEEEFVLPVNLQVINKLD